MLRQLGLFKVRSQPGVQSQFQDTQSYMIETVSKQQEQNLNRPKKWIANLGKKAGRCSDEEGLSWEAV